MDYNVSISVCQCINFYYIIVVFNAVVSIMYISIYLSQILMQLYIRRLRRNLCRAGRAGKQKQWWGGHKSSSFSSQISNWPISRHVPSNTHRVCQVCRSAQTAFAPGVNGCMLTCRSFALALWLASLDACSRLRSLNGLKCWPPPHRYLAVQTSASLLPQ